MISANGVEYKNLPEQVQYLTERAAEFAVELNRVSTSLEGVTTSVESLQTDVGGLQTDVAALQTSYTSLAEDVRIDKVNINTIFGNLGTIFTDITHIKNGTTHLFETITDKNGNPRFVEGDITINQPEGITQTYGKWSLSGTHLMIVVCCKIANGTTITAGWQLTNIILPQFILDKITPEIGETYIDTKIIEARSNVFVSQNFRCSLAKLIQGTALRLIASTGMTATNNLSFRIQFDLLIDDE